MISIDFNCVKVQFIISFLTLRLCISHPFPISISESGTSISLISSRKKNVKNIRQDSAHVKRTETSIYVDTFQPTFSWNFPIDGEYMQSLGFHFPKLSTRCRTSLGLWPSLAMNFARACVLAWAFPAWSGEPATSLQYKSKTQLLHSGHICLDPFHQGSIHT